MGAVCAMDASWGRSGWGFLQNDCRVAASKSCISNVSSHLLSRDSVLFFTKIRYDYSPRLACWPRDRGIRYSYFLFPRDPGIDFFNFLVMDIHCARHVRNANTTLTYEPQSILGTQIPNRPRNRALDV